MKLIKLTDSEKAPGKRFRTQGFFFGSKSDESEDLGTHVWNFHNLQLFISSVLTTGMYGVWSSKFSDISLIRCNKIAAILASQMKTSQVFLGAEKSNFYNESLSISYVGFEIFLETSKMATTGTS